MKKIISLSLVIILALSVCTMFAACSNNNLPSGYTQEDLFEKADFLVKQELEQKYSDNKDVKLDLTRYEDKTFEKKVDRALITYKVYGGLTLLKTSAETVTFSYDNAFVVTFDANGENGRVQFYKK